MPTSITLKVLHDIIQITVGWLDYHLWQFTIGGQTYGLPTEEDWGVAPRLQATKVRLRDVLAPPTTTIDYMYDFGDSWAHRLIVSGIRQGESGLSYPRYIGGAWSAPPEDCGGIPGYYNMLNAPADARHPNHAEVSEYLEGWNPEEIEEFPIRIALGRTANRRNAARTGIAKKKS